MRSLLLVIICWLSCAAFTQSKRALVLGLGQQEDKSWAKINGDKDVPWVVAMLKGFGYKDIRTLVNAEATKRNIVARFKELTSRCCKGDVVYIHFSGHGQLMTDTDGDEEDGYDEAWIPYDAYLKYNAKDRGEKHLSDDEIGRLLAVIRDKVGEEGQLLVVVDACHSGDSSRKLQNDECVRGVIQKFEIPLTSAPKKKKKKQELWITVSACKNYQLNVEMKEPKVGKLTYGIYQLREKLVKLNNVAFEKELNVFYRKNRATLIQSPVISGQKEKYNINDVFEKLP